MNLWILTEERAKKTVISTILDIYCSDRNLTPQISNTNILPQIKVGAEFSHVYKFLGYKIDGIENIFLKMVSGFSSFADFLLFESEEQPNPEEQFRNCLYIIEETKTGSGSAGSRNTSAAQRATKFSWLHEQKIKNLYAYELIMLYNKPDDQKKKDPASVRSMKQCLESIGVRIYGDNPHRLKPFTSFEDVIEGINSKPLPQPSNTPVRIEFDKSNNHLYLSGTLANPVEKGNIGHDPNMGGHIGIVTALRHFGYQGQITITDHKVKQSKINNMRGNKYTFASGFLDFNLEGLSIPEKLKQKENEYWYYQEKTEKTASILLHLLCNHLNFPLIYENHAGAERGYFYKSNGDYYAIEKTLNLPDYVFRDEDSKKIFLLEGEMAENLSKGKEQLKGFDAFERLHIKKHYKDYSIFKGIILSNSEENYSDPEIIFAISKGNKILISQNCPKRIRSFINLPS